MIVGDLRVTLQTLKEDFDSSGLFERIKIEKNQLNFSINERPGIIYWITVIDFSDYQIITLSEKKLRKKKIHRISLVEKDLDDDNVYLWLVKTLLSGVRKNKMLESAGNKITEKMKRYRPLLLETEYIWLGNKTRMIYLKKSKSIMFLVFLICGEQGKLEIRINNSSNLRVADAYKNFKDLYEDSFDITNLENLICVIKYLKNKNYE